MTKDDIIRMAREAKMFYQPQAGWIAGLNHLERFAALVAAAERAECAKVCDEVAEFPSLTPRHCAESIRARKEQP